MLPETLNVYNTVLKCFIIKYTVIYYCFLRVFRRKCDGKAPPEPSSFQNSKENSVSSLVRYLNVLIKLLQL